jgi:hypothetical protein
MKHLWRKLDSEVEFITIMSFDSLAALLEFAGRECDLAVVQPKAHQPLARYGQQSKLYRLRVEKSQSTAARYRIALLVPGGWMSWPPNNSLEPTWPARMLSSARY